MNRVAARERFLVLYPEQDRRANLQGCWNWYDTDSGQAYREAATLKAAIDQVGLMYPVDRGRVALAGMSAGASMAALLATRYPRDFRAVVMHSGIPPGAAHSPASAVRAMRGHLPNGAAPGTPLGAPINTAAPLTTTAWPPLLVIQGSRDRVVSARNAQNAAQMWAQAAGARAAPPRGVRRGKRYPLSITDFKLGRKTVASLCEVEGLAHDWSGGDGNRPFGDDQGPDASRMIWSFAARQFRDAGDLRAA
jgi:poly(hydroxyalkanoate) depolymerase family esterase